MIGVSVAPGLTTFTRMPRFLSSTAHVSRTSARQLGGPVDAVPGKAFTPTRTNSGRSSRRLHQRQRFLHREQETAEVDVDGLSNALV